MAFSSCPLGTLSLPLSHRILQPFIVVAFLFMEAIFILPDPSSIMNGHVLNFGAPTFLAQSIQPSLPLSTLFTSLQDILFVFTSIGIVFPFKKRCRYP